MGKVEIRELTQTLLAVAGKRIDDASLPTELLGLDQGVGNNVARGSINAVLGATVAVAIHLYNAVDDNDEDGVLGAAAAKKPSAPSTSTDWRPQLAFATGQAWLKYSLEAEATAGATSKIGSAGGSIGGARSLRLLSYKRHDGSERIETAVAGDLGDLHGPLAVADILALAVQEACALKIRGKLTASLSVSWSDIFSTSLHEFAEFRAGRTDDPLLIDVSSAASASFTISVDDDFTLCFVRQKAGGDDAIRVALRKSITHDRRFSAKAGIEVEFADPSAAREVLLGVMAGVLDAPAEALQALERAPSLDAIPDKYQWLVKALAERFGIAGVDPLAPIKDKLRELDGLLNDRIDQLARTKLSAGFRYEYLRIASEASLLEATLSEAALGELHGAILAFDFATVLAYSEPGLALDFFLHQRTVDRVRSFGFSLGIGTWLKLSSKQTRRDLFVDRRYISADGTVETRAYLGSTVYKASANTWSSEYGAMLKADLEEARAPEQASTREFKCGLHLWWEEAKLQPVTRLPRIVDDAVLWGVIGVDAAAALHERLQQRLHGTDNCKTRLSVLLGDAGLRDALRLISLAGDMDFGRHAARALPWQARHPARASSAQREAAYAAFFSAYAQSTHSSGDALKQLISSSLRDQAPGLLGQEGKGETPWTLYQVLLRADAGTTHVWKHWQELRAGAAMLAGLVDSRGDWADFDDAFGLMSPCFEQAYLIRTVASLLAQGLPGARKFAPTLTVTYDVAGKEQAIVVGGKK